ncbi:hypothetical protein P692DRAFT_20847011 [Suillus brevipes Sb2]|nr:hypothetical protein P692DRAFT_20847011 [Suillus brevipes Sb2]
MTISPLKRLQATQALESMKYGINTLSINEDTPNDPSLWEDIHTGKFSHLIVSPEQLSMFNGHLPHHVSFTLSTNRVNITYATTLLIGGPRNFQNFNCHDNKQEAAAAAAHNDSRLLKALQNQGIVKHYHSDMSAEYLRQIYNDFASVSGTCRIIHATAGASTGLDVQGVMFVIQYGIPKNISEALQRGGLWGLYLMMIETWALEVNLIDEHNDTNDPDKPYTITALKKNPSKRDCTGCAALQYVQSKTCLQEFFAKYLNDQTPTEGRKLLDKLLAWRLEAHSNHPLQSVWPIT